MELGSAQPIDDSASTSNDRRFRDEARPEDSLGPQKALEKDAATASNPNRPTSGSRSQERNGHPRDDELALRNTPWNTRQSTRTRRAPMRPVLLGLHEIAPTFDALGQLDQANPLEAIEGASRPDNDPSDRRHLANVSSIPLWTLSISRRSTVDTTDRSLGDPSATSITVDHRPDEPHSRRWYGSLRRGQL